MINYTTLPPVGTSAPASDPNELGTCPETGPSDPLRQLFHRNANHLNSAHTRRLHARVQHRLFAEDSERG